MKSLWGYIRTCIAFVVYTDKMSPGARIEFSPTHTVLKRNPDRSYSEEFRSISDLRRANRWLEKGTLFRYGRVD